MMSWFPTGPSSSPLLPGKKVGAGPRAPFFQPSPTSSHLIPFPYPPPRKWSSLPKSRTSTSLPRSPLPPRTMPSWSLTMRTRTTVTPVRELLFLAPQTHNSHHASNPLSTSIYPSMRVKLRLLNDFKPHEPELHPPNTAPATPESLFVKIIKTTTDIISRLIQSPKFPTKMRKSSRRSPFTSVSPP